MLNTWVKHTFNFDFLSLFLNHVKNIPIICPIRIYALLFPQFLKLFDAFFPGLRQRFSDEEWFASYFFLEVVNYSFDIMPRKFYCSRWWSFLVNSISFFGFWIIVWTFLAAVFAFTTLNTMEPVTVGALEIDSKMLRKKFLAKSSQLSFSVDEIPCITKQFLLEYCSN